MDTVSEITFSLIEESSLRADILLSSLLQISRNRVQKNIGLENLSVDGRIVSKNSFKRFKKGSLIEFEIESLEQLSVIPQEMKLDIIFENENFIIVNKPSGLVVHPGAGNPDRTLVNGIAWYFSKSAQQNDSNDHIRPGIVHRIDKDTSGLLVIAKTPTAFEKLSEKFARHEIEREYSCLVWGHLKQQNGTLETLHGRDPSNRLRFSPNVLNGRKAITHFSVESEFRYCSLLKVTLETGRTHQIRMHAAHIGHPVMNDPLYGGVRKTDDPKFNKIISSGTGQFLHAGRLGFSLSGENFLFSAAPPVEMTTALNYLEKISGG